jgi:hypothetical protein
MPTEYILDMTICLVNRTAVHNMGLEIYNIAQRQFLLRYWRFFMAHPIDFTLNPTISNVGKAIGRLTFKDLDSTWTSVWPRRLNHAMAFLDPIFSAKTKIEPTDMLFATMSLQLCILTFTTHTPALHMRAPTGAFKK